MAGRGRPPFPVHGNKAQKKNCLLSWIGRKVLEEKQPPKSDSLLQPSESDSSLNMVGQELEGTAPTSTELGCLTCHESKGSVHIAIEFLNALIEYRSEYLIYPFESQVAIEDFIKNWITVPKRTFENLIDEFQRTYLDEIPDSAIDILEPIDQKVCELAKKIWVTDGMRIAEEDNIRVRFLERLTNDVNDQITFLKKIIEHLPKTPTARLPVDDLPVIDNLIKNWLKVEVPKSELEKVILTLRRKYIGTENKGEKITDLKEEDQKAIQLVEMIWGPVFGTQNRNDQHRTENLTDG